MFSNILWQVMSRNPSKSKRKYESHLANGRYWGKIVSSIIFGIGFIMAGFTEKKQALYDIMTGTLVVKK